MFGRIGINLTQVIEDKESIIKPTEVKKEIRRNTSNWNIVDYEYYFNVWSEPRESKEEFEDHKVL